jgi:subtilisin-like proprotein convertase family protein
LKVAADAACGSSFTGKIILTAGPRQASITKVFDIGRSMGTPEKFMGEALPVEIKDNQTVYSPTQISGTQWEAGTKVKEAYLKFDATHSYVGDLKIGLVSPEGKTIEVYAGSGDSRDIHFSRDVSQLVAGQVGAGQWKIYVTDTASRDEGTLTSFELTLTPNRFVCE